MRAAFHARRLPRRRNGNSSAADEGVAARSDLGELDYLDQVPVRVCHPGDEQSIQPRFASRHAAPLLSAAAACASRRGGRGSWGVLSRETVGFPGRYTPEHAGGAARGERVEVRENEFRSAACHCVLVLRSSAVVKVATGGHQRADRQAEQGSEKSRG